jgi:hypothetical protein
MRAIFVPLPEGVVDRLRQLARREMRGTREQAAMLLIEGLRRAEVRAAKADQTAGAGTTQ